MGMKVVTDHGCSFTTGYSVEELRGATMDCKGHSGHGTRCNKLIVFPADATYPQCTRARDFHAWLHEQSPQWPADGAGTYAVEVGA